VSGLVREISVGSAQHVWGICKDGNIYRFDAPSNNWTQVQCPHRLSDLRYDRVFFARICGVRSAQSKNSVGSDGTVYVVDANQQIYKYEPNGTWFHVPGLLVSIRFADSVLRFVSFRRIRLLFVSVADSNDIFGCNAQGEVFRLTPPTSWQKLSEFTAPVRRLSIGSL
jgi:hypothetical protein